MDSPAFHPRKRALHPVLAAPLLLLFFWLAVASALDKSPTFDEGFYITRGWAAFRTGVVLPLGHPPLTNLISGLGVLLEPRLPDPHALDGWDEQDPERVSRDFMWNRGLNVERVTLLARLPTVWLALALGALLWRWAAERYGGGSSLLALALYSLCPNLIAHGQLATTDLGVAAFYVATVYAWLRFLQRPSWRWLLAGGVLFGLAQASKFSAVLLIPTLFVLTFVAAWQKGGLPLQGADPFTRISHALARTRFGRLLGAAWVLLILTIVGGLTIWAVDFFSLQPLNPGRYLGELLHFLALAGEGHRAYLLGMFSNDGWWYYHLITLGVKLPETTFILLLLAAMLGIGRRNLRSDLDILFAAGLYLGATLAISLNVGVRYLLPVLPLLYLFASRFAAGPLTSGWLRPAVIGLLVAGNALVTLLAYPHYLAYFNAVAGGPANGYRILADSNLDWGQDLPGLAAALRRRDDDRPIYLSYFGQADPAYYGIDYRPLPAWPPAPPERVSFYPLNPAPGLYAISASNLLGVQLYEPESFGYFRVRPPQEQIGYSIFLYEVTSEEYLTPAWVGQCSEGAVESERALRRLTGVRSIDVHYFDCASALPFFDGPGWLLLPSDVDPVVDLGPPHFLSRQPDGTEKYRGWRLAGAPPPPASKVEFPPVSLPLPLAGHLDLLGYTTDGATDDGAGSLPGARRPGDTLILTVWWRVRQPPPPPVSIFAHLLAADDSLLVAGDALGVAAEDWQPGMVIIQQHRLTIPAGAEPGTYSLTLGLYSLATGERFPVARSLDRVVDRIVLRPVEIAGAAP